MKAWLRGFLYSFPIQLFFLHFRKYQVLLLFWFILFSTVNGSFMKTFGADSLFLAPEYLGNVNSFSSAIVGMSVGMFIMSWNIATNFQLVPHDKGFGLASTLAWLRQRLKIPVYEGLPFGHVTKKVMLPIGRKMDLVVQGRDLLLLWED